jgi:hypothetical protein
VERLEWYLWFAIYFNDRQQKYSGLCNLAATTVGVKLLDDLEIPFYVKHGQMWFEYMFDQSMIEDHIFMSKVNAEKVCSFVINMVGSKPAVVRKNDLRAFTAMFARTGVSVVVSTTKAGDYVNVRFKRLL